MGVEPTSPAWKAGTFAARPRAHKAEGEGVEPPRLIARPLSGRLPSPIGLTFHNSSCGGRNRTCVGAINSRLPVPTRVPPQSRSGRRDLNPRSRAPDDHAAHGARRNTRLSYVLHPERPAGVEPALPPWHGGRLPPTMLRTVPAWARFGVPNCQTTRAPGETRTLVTALRVRYPRRWTTSAIASVGPEGLEPSPGGLRIRYAAANTLIPCSPFLTRREWARRESNPQSDPYKRPALTVELRAVTGEWGRKDLNLHQPD